MLQQVTMLQEVPSAAAEADDGECRLVSSRCIVIVRC